GTTPCSLILLFLNLTHNFISKVFFSFFHSLAYFIANEVFYCCTFVFYKFLYFHIRIFYIILFYQTDFLIEFTLATFNHFFYYYYNFSFYYFFFICYFFI